MGRRGGGAAALRASAHGGRVERVRIHPLLVERWFRVPVLAGLVPLLFLLGLAYGPALPGFFVSDDLDMLSGDASDLFSPASGFGRFMPLAAAIHRVVALTSGLVPWPAHALQLALHVTCTLLVYALVRQLLAARGARRAVAMALLAAALFALYPRHHQVVMWFGAVSIGLAATLALATTLVFLRAWRADDPRAGWIAVGLYTAALLAHESAVALPALLGAVVVYEWSAGGYPRRWPPRAWVWAGVGVLVAHLALLAWAYRARAAAFPESGYRFVGVDTALLLAPPRYAAQLVVPPPWTEALAAGDVGVLVGALALAAAAVAAWRGSAAVRLGLAWAAFAAAPFVLFGIYGVTDRYYYLPSVGVALAVAVGLERRPRLAVLATASYALASALLITQAGVEWRAAGFITRATMDDLGAWAGEQRRLGSTPDAVLFVGVPFKRGEGWPGSQVYIFSTGLVGAAHLATGWPGLQVSYVFEDEHRDLAARLGELPVAAGPTGLYLFGFDPPAMLDRSDRLGSALPLLARLRWHGAARTPVDWGRYAGAADGP
jgi:hypothetical protein